MFISFQLAKASQTQENLYYLIKIFNRINSSLFSAFTASRTPKEQQQGAFSCPTAHSPAERGGGPHGGSRPAPPTRTLLLQSKSHSCRVQPLREEQLHLGKS